MTTLNFVQAVKHLDSVSPSVADLLENWELEENIESVQVAEIDPVYAGGRDLCEHYGVPFESGANCVVVAAKRGDVVQYAACVAPVETRMDFNKTIRKALEARKVSLAPLDFILEQTKMEYGSITPVGLPKDWKILLDERVATAPEIIIGSGLLKSKLKLPGKLLAALPNALVIPNLAVNPKKL